MEKIAIFVPNEQAQQFLLFQQYFEPITIIINANVFTTRNGSAEIHFDSEGKIRTISKHEVSYRYGKTVE